jgi:predicted deacylase
MGTLRVPYSHNRSAYGHLPVPIFSARHGSRPTVLLIGGVHGDEYEGPPAISGLIRRFPLKRLKGRVIAVPMLNAPAVLADLSAPKHSSASQCSRSFFESRCSPGDMDRCDRSSDPSGAHIIEQGNLLNCS